MELYQLRSFAAVAELGHLTRAAERLHISQPAVSAQIKALEDELGVTLFERVSSGMVLTSAGRKLLPAAEKVARRRAGVAQPRAQRSRARSSAARAWARCPTRSSRASANFSPTRSRRTPARDRDPPRGVRRRVRKSARRRRSTRASTTAASSTPTWRRCRSSTFAYRIVAPAAWGDRIRHASWDELVQMPWILAPPISTLRTLVEDFSPSAAARP